jgi:hypothetical protein
MTRKMAFLTMSYVCEALAVMGVAAVALANAPQTIMAGLSTSCSADDNRCKPNRKLTTCTSINCPATKTCGAVGSNCPC